MATEKRLIFADTAKEMIVNHANEFSDVLNRREKALLIGGGTSCIDKCPTVDAVEVVRCNDCKHYVQFLQDNKECRCTIFSGCYDRPYPTEPDDFCSYGERRTEDES